MLSVSSLAYADKWEHAKLVQASHYNYETDKVTYSWYFKDGSSPAVTCKNDTFKNKMGWDKSADIVDVVNKIGGMGWELVYTDENPPSYNPQDATEDSTFWFKRRID